MDYENDDSEEGRICLFDSHTNSVEQIAKFTNSLLSDEVATTKDKVDYFIWHYRFCKFQILAIDSWKSLFEIYDLSTRQISRGLLNKFINDRLKEFYRPRSS